MQFIVCIEDAEVIEKTLTLLDANAVEPKTQGGRMSGATPVGPSEKRFDATAIFFALRGQRRSRGGRLS
jgi:hypothetical protein